MSPDGDERCRNEGYLPREEFEAFLELALARVHVVRKHWKDAEACYQRVIDRYKETLAVPEAIYWRGVCRYKETEQHEPLVEMQEQLKKYPASEWAIKSTIW